MKQCVKLRPEENGNMFAVIHSTLHPVKYTLKCTVALTINKVIITSEAAGA